MDHAGSTTSRNFNQILDTSSCSDCETSAMTWSYCPTLQGRVLSVVMHQVKHPVPIDVLNHLFSVYGVVETLFQSLNQHGRKVLIQYQHDYMADNALRATHGWYLYSTYCQLDVQHAYPAELQILYDYSCAFLAEINTSEQKLTHEVAMPQVEAIDDPCSVIPHLKGKNSEQQPHVIQQLLAQIQANLAAICENLSQDLKHMKQNGERTWDCSQQTAASQPNPPTQEVIKVFDETPTCDVYDDEVSDCSNGSVNVLDVNLEQQQCGNGDAMPELEKSQDGDKLSRAKPDDEILVICSSKALETASLEVATEFACSDVFDNILEQQHHAEEIVQLRQALHWNMLFTEQRRDDWDPGKHIHPSFIPSDFAKPLQLTQGTLSLALQYQLTLNSVPRKWDPGDTQFQVLFTAAAGTTKMQYTDACTSVRLQVLDVQFNARRALISESDVLCYLAYGLRWTELNAAVLLVLAVKCSPDKAKLQWDPGIAISSYIWLNILTGCSALDKQLPCTHITVVAAEPNHSYLKLFMHSVCRATTRQVAEQRHLLEPSFKVVMLLNGLGFTEGQPAYMSWDPGILGMDL